MSDQFGANGWHGADRREQQVPGQERSRRDTARRCRRSRSAGDGGGVCSTRGGGSDQGSRGVVTAKAPMLPVGTQGAARRDRSAPRRRPSTCEPNRVSPAVRRRLARALHDGSDLFDRTGQRVRFGPDSASASCSMGGLGRASDRRPRRLARIRKGSTASGLPVEGPELIPATDHRQRYAQHWSA
jgi:hypothetical protein